MAAGYSGTPLAQKLGIKPGHKLAFVSAPAGFDRLLELPTGTSPLSRATSDMNVVVFFTTSGQELGARFSTLAASLAPAGALWIAWPKKSSGKKTDLDENAIRAVGLAAGLVDNKVCAIDEVWSGLRFVIRVKDRPRTKR